MAKDGECIKEDFLLIPDNPFPVTIEPDLPDRQFDCCNDFFLYVLADTGSGDDLKNDKKCFTWFFPSVITTVVMELQKHNGTQYVTVATLNDNTYGTYHAYGFFTNPQDEKFVMYEMEWKNVLTLHGPGQYVILVTLTAAIGSPALSGTFYSYEYCLSQYTPQTAQGTVRIDYMLKGITGRIDTDLKAKDYSTLEVQDQIRLKGFFGYPVAEYTTDYVTYNDGSRKFVEDEQEPEYILKLKPAPAFVHNLMRIDVMMADSVAITDYNNQNAENLVYKYVQKASGYAPDWKYLKTKLAPVEVKWRQEFNNLRKLRF
jgi:hypothetical protein